MAVPSGKYELAASVDLSPVFGIIASTHEVDVRVPGPEVLDEHLGRLGSENQEVRRRAIYALRYFREDADRVVPALMDALEDEDIDVRCAVLSVLMSYSQQARAHLPVFVEILETGEDREVLMAIQLVSRVAPASDEILAAMEKALAGAPENYRRAYESSIKRYRDRTGAK